MSDVHIENHSFSVYERLKKAIEDHYPVDKFGIMFRLVNPGDFMVKPDEGSTAVCCEITSLETGVVVRNAMAYGRIDVDYDPFGLSRLQTVALRRILAYMGYDQDSLDADDAVSQSQYDKIQSQSHIPEGTEIIVSSDTSSDAKTKPKVKSKQKAKPEAKPKSHPRESVTDQQLNVINMIADSLGFKLKVEITSSRQAQEVLEALRMAKAKKDDGEDFAEVLEPYV